MHRRTAGVGAVRFFVFFCSIAYAPLLSSLRLFFLSVNSGIGALLSAIRRHRKWVNMGQQVHKYENLLNRQFRADRPNSKWVTDISLYPYQAGDPVPVHDPGPLRQQYCGLQNRHTADGQSGAGYHPPGYAQSCNSTATRGFRIPHKRTLT